MQLSPLVAAVLAALAAAFPAGSIAADPLATPGDSLPDLGTPKRNTGTSIAAGPGGITAQGNFDGTKVVVAPEYSTQTGVSLGVTLASMFGDNAALGLLLNGGTGKNEVLLNAGFKADERQRIIVTAGQLKQSLDFRFPSGTEKVVVAQYSAGLGYRLQLDREFLRYLEINGYLSRTPSRDLADKTYAIDTANLYELWNDPRRIAGGRIDGLQGRLGFAPLEGSLIRGSFGYERLSYDLLAGSESTNRPTAGLEWQQQLGSGFKFNLGAESFASQNRYSLGVERRLADAGGHHTVGLSLIGVQGRDGLGNDRQVRLAYSYTFGAGASASMGASAGAQPALPADPVVTAGAQGRQLPHNPLLDQVAVRPSYVPSRVIAKVDTTAAPTRLVAIDKTALPAGSTIDAATGDLTMPLGISVTGIAGITRNLAAFTNSGQFALSNNTLTVSPSKMVPPAAGAIDSYVVSINNAGGGTTLVTVLVSKGSVHIDSISIVQIGATAPTANAVSIGGIAQVGRTLTGNYTYADANYDPQGTSTFRWLRNGVAIAGATATTYTLVNADQGSTITFEVTPVSTVAPTTGTTVVSAATFAVAGVGAPAAPTASAVSISGTAQVGQLLTGNYTYADANSDPQGTSTFRWLRNGAAIAGATATTYTLVNADQGNTITFEVTPVSTVAPTTGTPVVSSATATVAGVGAPAAPTASAVSISGTAQVGQTLTGSYTYADANNDPQGTSSFRWLRGGTAIAGATATTYTLVNADQGNTIAFEVTPVSTVAPTTGTTVVSSATATVAGVGAPAAPTASGVSISGTAQVGQTLSGNYTYADANNDPQGTSTFRWLRNGVAIAGATATTYTLVNADQGNTITFEVTPVTTVAPTTGTPVVSAATSAVAGVGVPAAPTASAVSISGTAQVGQTLTGSYTYADANNDPEGTSTFRWLRGGVAIAGATASTYTLVDADQGSTITFEVTPVSTVAPTTGTPVVSSATAAVASQPFAPTASAVSISGTAQVGQTLTGTYTYADANNDPQGTSTFRWLRSGVAIAGATATTYTLVNADQGNTITFEVTPVSTVAPTTGTPVVSSATGTVAGVGAPAAPTASGVSISGTAFVGQTLTGNYTYADANNDPQGSSTFRWLRDGVAIAGATASTYTLVADDYYKAITFEVTPVATAAPTTGTATVSGSVPILGLPANYLGQGGLIWMPITFTDTWNNAAGYCAGFNGLSQSGWRQPTREELSALYYSMELSQALYEGTIGTWTLTNAWSSSQYDATSHYYVHMTAPFMVGGIVDSYNGGYVSCVRPF